MIGKTISHYRITEKIGEGGMGEVYLAEDTELKRQVALKFLPQRVADDADALARFKREAQTAAALNHPNIITIHEIGSYEGRPYIAMSYIEGGTLRDEMDGGVSEDRALDIVIQACDGLEKAHGAGIVHRDIKPENFMSDLEGRLKILDFGIATFSEPGDSESDATTAGTAYYMSPEQARGEKMDARSDIFSLGTILYELLAGKRPFKGEHTSAVQYSIFNEDPEPLTRINSSVDVRLERVVSKTLEKNPDDRYQSAAALAADLEALRSGTATRTGKTATLKRLAFPGLVALVALVLFYFVNPFKNKSAVDGGAGADENTLAIMYFENLAQGGDPDRLGEIITDLLITNLSQSEDLKVVSSQRLYDILKLQGKEGAKVIDRTTATEIAKTAKARWMMLGSILQVTPSLIVTTQLVDVTTGTIEGSQRLTGSPGETVFALVDRMTGEARTELEITVPLNVEPPRPIADVTTNSLDAYRYYVEGLENENKLYYVDAGKSFAKAIELDSTFAMAHFKYAVTALNTDDYAGALASLDQAVRHIDRVSEKERLYIEAMKAMIELRWDEGIAKLTELTEKYPDQKEVFFWLASSYFGRGDIERAIEYYEKVLELDPLHRPSYNQLAYSYNRTGDFEKSISTINRYIELSPGEANPYDSRADLYAYNGDIDNAIASYKRALEIKPDFHRPMEKLGSMYLFKGQYDEAAAQYQQLSASDQPAIRSMGRRYPAVIALYQGRLRDAIAAINNGLAADEMEGYRSDAYFRKFFLRGLAYIELKDPGHSDAAPRELLRVLKGMYPMLAATFDLAFAGYFAEGGHIAWADSVVGLYKSSVDTFNPAALANYHYAIGMIALESNDPATTISHLEITDSLFPDQYGTRYRLADAYLRGNRVEDAISLLETILNRYDQSRLAEPTKAVLGYYLLGTAYQKAGETNKATEQFQKFVDIWKDADPELGQVSDAKNRLDQLRAGG